MSPPYSYVKSFFWKDEGWTIPWNNFTHLLHLLFHSKLHNNGLVLYQCLSKGVGISSTLPHQIKYPIFIEAKVILTSKNEECKIKIVSIDFIINLFLPFLLFISYMLMKKYQGTFQKYLTKYALSLRAAG